MYIQVPKTKKGSVSYNIEVFHYFDLKSTVSNPDSEIPFGDEISGGFSLDREDLLCLGGGTGAGGAPLDFKRFLILMPPL